MPPPLSSITVSAFVLFTSMAIIVLYLNAKVLNHRQNASPYRKQHHCVIFCVQETHFSQGASPYILTHIFITFLKPAACPKIGAFVIKATVAFQLHDSVFDPEGHYILICTINRVSFILINIWAPNSHQISCFKKALRKVRRMQQGHLCGDFNFVLDCHLDSSSSEKRCESPFKASLHAHDIFDMWRCYPANLTTLLFTLPQFILTH